MLTCDGDRYLQVGNELESSKLFERAEETEILSISGGMLFQSNYRQIYAHHEMPLSKISAAKSGKSDCLKSRSSRECRLILPLCAIFGTSLHNPKCTENPHQFKPLAIVLVCACLCRTTARRPVGQVRYLAQDQSRKKEEMSQQALNGGRKVLKGFTSTDFVLLNFV